MFETATFTSLGVVTQTTARVCPTCTQPQDGEGGSLYVDTDTGAY